MDDLSDHRPVIVGLELEPASVARQWNVDLFVTEIERRHGAEAASVVRSLVDWANDKQVELRRGGRGDVGLVRFPTSKGADPELWLQIDFPSDRPKYTQYTISIRATGDIVLQFQGSQTPTPPRGERDVAQRAGDRSLLRRGVGGICGDHRHLQRGGRALRAGPSLLTGSQTHSSIGSGASPSRQSSMAGGSGPVRRRTCAGPNGAL
jgi:hypothetical protein